jgi:hypothetical protein
MQVINYDRYLELMQGKQQFSVPFQEIRAYELYQKSLMPLYK